MTKMIGKRLAVLAGLAASFAANAAPVAADADHPRWKLQPLLHHIAPVKAGGECRRCVVNLEGWWGRADRRTGVIEKVQPDGYKSPVEKIVRDEPVDVGGITNWAKVYLPTPGIGRGGMDDRTTSFFRRTFETPAGWREGDSVILSMERTGESFDIYMNGRKTSSHGAMVNLLRRIDVSENVRRGTNELVVACRVDGRRLLDWRDDIQWYLTENRFGITGPVHLEFTGPAYIRRGHVMTYVTPKREIAYEAHLRNNATNDMAVTLTVDVPGVMSFGRTNVTVKASGETKVVMRRSCDRSVRLWTPTDPHLQFMQFRLQSAKNPGAELDTLRTRFGFREVKAQGHRMLLNGKPVIFRRQTRHPEGLPTEDFATYDECTNTFAALRRDGINSLRVRWTEQERVADAADEWGMMIEPCAYGTMGAAGKSDIFWRAYEAYLAEMVDQLRNHPSIVDWAVSNEFGTFYSGVCGTKNEIPTTLKQIKAAKVVEEADPTRVWTACGEEELAMPVRHGLDGAAPVRSFHYPFPAVADGGELPNAAYWYARGEPSWQSNSRKNKPLFISEDIYHGCQDSPLGLSKYAGDYHFEMEGEHGYYRTVAWVVRSYAAGYYYAGLGQWEPWCTFPGNAGRRCHFFDHDGQLMPDYLINYLEFPRNLFAGETVVRTLNCYNEWFTDYPEACLYRTDIWVDADGATHAEDRGRIAIFMWDAGSRFWRTEEIAPPAAAKDGSTYSVRYTVKASREANAATVAEETLDFIVYGRRADPLAEMKAYSRPADLVGLSEVVVTGKLAFADGLALEKWVRKGGKALVLDLPDDSWAPVEIEYGLRATFVWRRLQGAMPEVDEHAMRSWAPDGYPSLSAIPKPEEDSDVLWDVGRKDGLSSAAAVRVYRGCGNYLICQMPLVRRFAVEPAAGVFLESLVKEFRCPSTRPSGAVFVESGANTNRSIECLVQTMGAQLAGRATAQVAWIDASKGLGVAQRKMIDDFYASGRTVIVTGLPADTDPDFLSTWGVRTVQSAPVQTRHGWLPGKLGGKADTRPKWVTRSPTPGLLRGVSNDDLFWWTEEGMSFVTQIRATGWEPGGRDNMVAATAILEPIPGSETVPVVATRPSAWCEYANASGGRLVLSTLTLADFTETRRARVTRFVRRVLMNAGVRTSGDQPLREMIPLDFSAACNRNLWQDPQHKKPDGTFDPDGWFGDGNDLRYFPVNLCGWSRTSGAYCPKQPMPTKPLNLGSVPFRITDPLKNGGRACLVLNPGDVLTWDLPTPVAASAFQFLGAFSKWAKKDFAVEISFNDDEKPAETVRQDVHVGWYRMTNVLPVGRTAWVGVTPMDPSATLYRWPVRVPDPRKPVTKVTFRNVGKTASLGIIAASAEREIPVQ